jgi:hypothetical protein
MGESKRKRGRRLEEALPTLRQHMGLPPCEPIVLKFFTGHDFLAFLATGASGGGDADELWSAVRAVMLRVTSGDPAVSASPRPSFLP